MLLVIKERYCFSLRTFTRLQNNEISSVSSCCCLVATSCPILCNPVDCNTPGSSVFHCLLEFAQIHVHWVPILWPPDLKSQLIGKDPDVAKDWRQKEKRTTEDEMVGWHHRLNGCELGQTREDGEGQGGLACCSPWGQKESDRTWWLNNNNTYEGAACGGFETYS